MSQDFKLKFDTMLQNDPSQSKEDEDLRSESYSSYSQARNLTFAWPDGRRQFMNYAFLIGAEYIPTEKAIILNFTSHTIAVKGYNLDKLFDDFLHHLPKLVVCSDSRYNSTFNQMVDIVVNEIIVTKEH